MINTFRHKLSRKSSWAKRCLFFMLMASLILAPFYHPKIQVKAQAPGSMVYFYPFAKNLSGISIARPIIVDQEGCVYLAGNIRGSSRISSFPIGGDIPGFSTEYSGGGRWFFNKNRPLGHGAIVVHFYWRIQG